MQPRIYDCPIHVEQNVSGKSLEVKAFSKINFDRYKASPSLLKAGGFLSNLLMTATIINLSIALLLGAYSFRSKDVTRILISSFLYISFHYSYAALPIFSFHFSISEYISLHQNTQAGVKLTGFGFLIFTLCLLVWRYRQHIFSGVHYGAEKWLRWLFMLWGLMVFTHWVIDAAGSDYPSKIAVQDIVSAFLLGIFAWSFGAALKIQKDITVVTQENICRLLLIVLSLMVAIGAWEILSFRIFFLVLLDSGEYVRRAKSLLFNPNVLGFWCSFVAIFSAYTYHSQDWPSKLSGYTLVLAGFGIILSGSRSGLTICFLFLGTAALLLFRIRKQITTIKSFRPLIIFAAGMGTISLVIKVLDNISWHAIERLHAMALLVDRFIVFPQELLYYILLKLCNFNLFSSSWLPKISEKMALPKATAILIDGRINPSTKIVDNGYWAMMHDGGWAALVLWIVLWAMLVILGFKSLRKLPGVNSAYALSLVIGCAFSAGCMRAFQIFPFWIMISLALSLCLSWYAVALGKGLPVHDKKV
jgi:hypothetical protein